MIEHSMTRRVLLAAGTLALLPHVPARANLEAMQAAIRDVVGGKPIKEGKVTIDIPSLVENGNTVPLSVKVDSPMSKDDRIVAIHVFNEKNPQPHVYHAVLGPAAPRASVDTRIKLGDSQKIVAIAETSRGEFWSGSADVIVTLAACLEDLT